MTRDEAEPPHLAAIEELAAGGDVAIGAGAPAIPGRSPGQITRRLLLYGFMIVVALLFLVPFLWSLSTSFMPLPETAQGFHLIPNNPTINAYHDLLTNPIINFVRVYGNSWSAGRQRHAHQPRPRLARRLRVRAASLPRTGAALRARAGDADDPRPAAPRPGLPDAERLPALPLEPDRHLPGLHPDQRGDRGEPLPDAAVLPHYSEGLRGGREASTARATSRRSAA